MERSINDTKCSKCQSSRIYREWCVCVERDCFLFYVCYLEWLNELIHFVVNGSYDKLFIEHPNLRNFVVQNHDEIINKLNHDQELVDYSYINFLKVFFLIFKRLIDLLNMIIGIAYLQLFVINNFVGPKVELENSEQSISQVNII